MVRAKVGGQKVRRQAALKTLREAMLRRVDLMIHVLWNFSKTTMATTSWGTSNERTDVSGRVGANIILITFG